MLEKRFILGFFGETKKCGTIADLRELDY